MKTWILYGSYGYTGNLIAEMASEHSEPVILAGRNEEKLKKQSARLGLNYCVADLENREELDEMMSEAELVLHCAGPFCNTWKPMAEACLRNRVHYLDITGEIDVFESLKHLGEQFRAREIMAMPGVGFDVVPSDCLAAYLYKKLPDATHLELAIYGLGSGFSRGTAKTMVENIDSGGAVRRGGEIERVPAAHLTRKIRFDDQWMDTVSIPWGDISTAYTSTGIGNIVVYAAIPKKMIGRMRWMNYLGPLFSLRKVKDFLKTRVDSGPAGPSESERRDGRSLVWGHVANPKGESVIALLKTKEGYQLTSETAFKIVRNVLDGKFKMGYQTPSAVYGASFILEFDNSEISEM